MIGGALNWLCCTSALFWFSIVNSTHSPLPRYCYSRNTDNIPLPWLPEVPRSRQLTTVTVRGWERGWSEPSFQPLAATATVVGCRERGTSGTQGNIPLDKNHKWHLMLTTLPVTGNKSSEYLRLGYQPLTRVSLRSFPRSLSGRNGGRTDRATEIEVKVSPAIPYTDAYLTNVAFHSFTQMKDNYLPILTTVLFKRLG